MLTLLLPVNKPKMWERQVGRSSIEVQVIPAAVYATTADICQSQAKVHPSLTCWNGPFSRWLPQTLCSSYSCCFNFKYNWTWSTLLVNILVGAYSGLPPLSQRSAVPEERFGPWQRDYENISSHKHHSLHSSVPVLPHIPAKNVKATYRLLPHLGVATHHQIITFHKITTLSNMRQLSHG